MVGRRGRRAPGADVPVRRVVVPAHARTSCCRSRGCWRSRSAATRTDPVPPSARVPCRGEPGRPAPPREPSARRADAATPLKRWQMCGPIGSRGDGVQSVAWILGRRRSTSAWQDRVVRTRYSRAAARIRGRGAPRSCRSRAAARPRTAGDAVHAQRVECRARRRSDPAGIRQLREFNGGSKASTVTILPQPGASASIALSFNGASNIRVDGLTITDLTFRARRATSRSRTRPSPARP